MPENVADLLLPGVVKSHGSLEGLDHGLFERRGDLLHGVYLMRDVRDIVVSLFHYVHTDDYRTNTDPSLASYDDIEAFYFEAFLSYFVRHHDWFVHAERWVAIGFPLVRYEGLWENPRGELERLFARWGLEVKADSIEKAVARNAISRMQKIKGLSPAGVSAAHYRRGGCGGYLEEFPPRVLADMDRRFGDLLRRWGYD